MDVDLPIHLFIDQPLVDELWTMLKREAIPVERVEEASGKIAGKAKFGFGKIWSWLAADVSGEVGLDGSLKHTEHLQYTSLFRSLLLRELLPSVQRIDKDHPKNISALKHDSFVQITCNNVEIVPLPTYSAFFRQYALHGIGQSQEDADLDYEKVISFLEKYSISARAMDLVMRVEDKGNNSVGIRTLFDECENIITNALSMSNDDHTLILGSALGLRPAGLIFCVARDDSLRRNLGAFTGARNVTVFGQVATLDAGHGHMGVLPVTISLG